jgi:hypothetical protein
VFFSVVPRPEGSRRSCPRNAQSNLKALIQSTFDLKTWISLDVNLYQFSF